MPQDPCHGGPAAAKPGVQRNAVLGSTAVEAILTFLQPELALVLAVPLASFDYDTFTICGAPPPDDPGLTQQDALDVLNFADPNVSGPAIDKLHTWFLSWYWYTLCECTGATTPAAPAPSNPGPVVTTNPGLPSGPAGKPCWDVSVNLTVPHINDFVDYSTSVLPQGSQQTIIPPFTGGPTSAAQIPTGASGLHMEWTLDAQPTSPNDVNLDFDFFDASGNFIQQVGVSWDGRAPLHLASDFVIPAAATAWFVVLGNGDPIAHNVLFEISFFCGGQSPSTPQTPCCPPDPLLEAQLKRILGLLQALYEGQPSPLNSYAESTVHAGLQGNGSFLLASAAIAVKVQLTSIPSAIGEESATPLLYFDVGYVVPIAAEAPLAGWRIIYSPQLFPLPQLTEQIGYTLAPGVVATITELTRGP